MTIYTVTGGLPLKGKIQLSGAKNAGFKAMIASLLGSSPSQISGLGLISEIDLAKKIITSLGGHVEAKGDPHQLLIDPAKLATFEIPGDLAGKSRSTTMYAGPLLAKFKKAVLPSPGGDISIAKRPIERHLDGLAAMGVKINYQNSCYVMESPNGLTGTIYRFAKNTHTGTETLILAATQAEGITVLNNAAAEPEVDDLITLLNAMGAIITRVESRTIKIVGVKRLRGVHHVVMKDRIEAATFGCMALASKGDVTVLGADPLVLNAFLVAVNEAGGRWEKTANGIRFWHEKPLRSTDIETAVYPGFMTDWQPLWTTLMTGAEGDSTVHETVMETRFKYLEDLKMMGAKIDQFNPVVKNPDEVYNFNLSDDAARNFHAAKIHGPTELSGKKIEIDDIRRGATLFLAGLAGKGVTVIVDPQDQIKRGYEDLAGRLQSLGAKITFREH